MVKAYAALSPGENLKLYEYEPEVRFTLVAYAIVTLVQ